MKKILLFRHESWIGAPRLVGFLEEMGIPYEFVNIDEGDPIPQEIPDTVAGLVFLGGTMSVNDPLPWIEKELRLIQKARERNFPVLGHCLGSQLISKALGGKVTTMPKKEIGWHPITFLQDETAKEWQWQLSDSIRVLLWHHDEFSLPPGSHSLYTTDNCQNQAFVLGNMLATVAHIEVSSEMLENWLRVYGHDISPNGDTTQSIEEIRENMENKITEMHLLTDTFYVKWLRRSYTRETAPLIHEKLRAYFKEGSCLCGAITFFLKRPRDVINCHCSECRKFHGNFAAYTKVSSKNIQLRGEKYLTWYRSEPTQTTRGFCGICGSGLFWKKDDSGLCVAAGALNIPTKLTTAANIHVDSASDYYNLSEELSSYPESLSAVETARDPN